MNEEMRLEIYSERVLAHDVNSLFQDNNMLIVSKLLFKF